MNPSSLPSAPMNPSSLPSAPMNPSSLPSDIPSNEPSMNPSSLTPTKLALPSESPSASPTRCPTPDPVDLPLPTPPCIDPDCGLKCNQTSVACTDGCPVDGVPLDVTTCEEERVDCIDGCVSRSNKILFLGAVVAIVKTSTLNAVKESSGSVATSGCGKVVECGCNNLFGDLGSSFLCQKCLTSENPSVCEGRCRQAITECNSDKATALAQQCRYGFTLRRLQQECAPSLIPPSVDTDTSEVCLPELIGDGFEACPESVYNWAGPLGIISCLNPEGNGKNLTCCPVPICLNDPLSLSLLLRRCENSRTLYSID
eukprot:scaffold4490_cov46-Attheya_sp.AAC.1